jgi:hypothetical protein
MAPSQYKLPALSYFSQRILIDVLTASKGKKGVAALLTRKLTSFYTANSTDFIQSILYVVFQLY